MEYQLESIRSCQKEEAEAAVNNGIYGLKMQTLQEVGKDIDVLETKLMVKIK